MYSKCPVCEGKRTVTVEFNNFLCPYCRSSGYDLYPEWPYERKMRMMNLISNKPIIDIIPNSKEIVHTPIAILKVSKHRGRPRKTV